MRMVSPEPMSGCWLWTGGMSGGYGKFSMVADGMKNLWAHRAALMLFKGITLPDGCRESVDHKCRNRACVNPDHLELVAHSENIARAAHVRRPWLCKGRTDMPLRASARRRERAQRETRDALRDVLQGRGAAPTRQFQETTPAWSVQARQGRQRRHRHALDRSAAEGALMDRECFFVQLRTRDFYCGLYVSGARALVQRLRDLEPSTVIVSVASFGKEPA